MSTKTFIGLAGNPNCGKTTLFNELTGSNGYVVTGQALRLRKSKLHGKKINLQYLLTFQVFTRSLRILPKKLCRVIIL